MKTRITNLLITILVAFIYFYFLLPPLNLTTIDFYIFISFIAIVYMILNSTSGAINIIKKGKMPTKFFKTESIIIGSVISIFVLISIVNLIFSPFFMADSYSKRITIDEDKKFTDEIKLIDPNTLPIIDKDSSIRLGDKILGRMPDFVSQFDVSELYTQINYKESIVRVTNLEYNDIFKFFTNKDKGITGYIVVDSVTGESSLVKLNKGMKYVDSAIFSKDLNRKLRFSYPTKIFRDIYFEIDDEGKPYFIVPSIKYNGINIRSEVEGVVILDPLTGDSKYYTVKNVPEWVDHVYPSDLVLEQINDWGKYKKGFLNSIFGQKGVVATTEGYNYTVLNNDVYLYTGLTSVIADKSNIGFVMINLRTKKTDFYSIPGSDEFSAMESAKGQVQEKKYSASFPLLINLNNKATYFISLKDNAGLVKMFAFVDVEDYQRVVVTDSSKGIEEAIKNYIGGEVNTGIEKTTESITVTNISSAIIEGQTFYYLIDQNNNFYKVNIEINESLLVFLKIGDSVNVEFSGKNTRNILKITK